MSLLLTLEFIAVAVSATYGILLAARQGMDFVGVFAVAFVAAFGGGTLRDLFLDRVPLFWVANPHYVLVVLALTLASGFIVRLLPRIKPLLPFPDAIGMALFTVVGTQIAIDEGTTWYLAALFGVITGTFGGVLAEIVCNEIPTLFKPAPLCATCNLTGAFLYLGGLEIGIAQPILLAVAIIVMVVFRLSALRWNLTLPALRG
ncbi:TRIC cation channel family protein [bacterium]|nr:TRIC cation channel family protein [Akkermansiaceae bacterium]MDB4266124.1 TRIC cation channel family protein [bacterium]MDA7864400.1 TRIC cation channel family protein [Akkermansiaceae bacterium]MDB4142379.1 TRIC cation channel family protein [Akkermansiaceae bacterium]MDB4274644.1 TRIC cation channel family protein [Akkermansiaceae bacterium]